MLSYLENIPEILRAVRESGAKRIVDIGPGFGKYGLLIREDYLSRRAEGGDLIPSFDDDFVLDCIEKTEYFTTGKILDAVYDLCMREDMFNVKLANSYDLALLIDVVEHHSKDAVLAWMRDQPDVEFLVSTPKNTVMYSEHYYGDPDHHVSQWKASDFKEFDMVHYSTDLSWILRLKKKKAAL